MKYRGKIYNATNRENIPRLGTVGHMDEKQVIIKRENKIFSYPAPGTDRQNALEISAEDFKRGKI